MTSPYRLTVQAPILVAVLVCGLLPRAQAQFSQQGSKLVGASAVNPAQQGFSVAVSADGNTALVGAPFDNGYIGGVWVWTRSGGAWTQQGPKLIGAGAAGNAEQGYSVALSADGNTALVGASQDNGLTGAAWVWTRSAGVWTQQGPKLTGSGVVGMAGQGVSVALSSDGNTALVGGPLDNGNTGAVWVWVRSSGAWTQQGSKLVGAGAAGSAQQGWAVALSADGNSAFIGGVSDNSGVGAAWAWTRTAGVWSQQGSKLVGSGSIGTVYQAYSVALSADGNTAILGGPLDNNGAGAVWVWTRSGGVWTQQGPKLFDAGADNPADQGASVSLSADGNTALVGAHHESGGAGAARVWTRSGGVWTQQGLKLVGAGAAGNAGQGISVALSADANTAIVGGFSDNSGAGAAWVFTPQPVNTLTPLGASPNAGSGLNQTISFTFNDPQGWQDLGVLNVLMNNSLDGRQACYIAYVPSGATTGTVLLVNDAGAAGGPFQSLAVPSAGSINNSQCTISGTGSSVSGSGNLLTLTLAMTFSSSFAGNKVMYMAARDAGTNNSGWQALGVWNVPGAPPTGPAVSGVSPARSLTASQTYTFTFTDTNGYQDLAVLNILINNSIDGRNACYVAYVPSGPTTGTLYLVNDAGAAGGPFQSLPVSGSGAVNNSQCTISGAGSSATASGNTLTLTLPITFSPGFAGNKIIYSAARSNTLSSNWQAVGSATAP